MAGGFNWQIALAVLVVLGVGYAFLGGNFTGAASTVTPYSTSCTDTDGFNTRVAGSCTDSVGTYTESCQSAGVSVMEYYCTPGNRCTGRPQQCGQNQKCVGGRCV